jgi:hypothetical protein
MFRFLCPDNSQNRIKGKPMRIWIPMVVVAMWARMFSLLDGMQRLSRKPIRGTKTKAGRSLLIASCDRKFE